MGPTFASPSGTRPVRRVAWLAVGFAIAALSCASADGLTKVNETDAAADINSLPDTGETKDVTSAPEADLADVDFPTDAAISPDDGAEAGPRLMAAVAAAVIPSCATSGCHDAVTQEHGMDLSTEQSIHLAWVRIRGLDHCSNAARVRVVPGRPDQSYVFDKITMTPSCDLGQRMPPPPKEMLSAVQIEAIRAWIAAGAPQ
jgi:hypothetical protein